jgi:hypothetical protein
LREQVRNPHEPPARKNHDGLETVVQLDVDGRKKGRD